MTAEMLELARANAAEAGADQRRVPAGHDRGRPAARRVGRRGDLQLRDQPVQRRQAGGAGRDVPRPHPRWADRDQRRRRRGPPHHRAAGRARGVRRLHRRRPVPAASTSTVSPPPASSTPPSEFTHPVADQMHSAIIRATKPAALRTHPPRPLGRRHRPRRQQGRRLAPEAATGRSGYVLRRGRQSRVLPHRHGSDRPAGQLRLPVTLAHRTAAEAVGTGSWSPR